MLARTEAAEPEVLRHYRHVLRTAPADWQEVAHRHALGRLGRADRAAVLEEVRRLLVTATRLAPDDVADLARIIVLAERRTPRVLLDGMPGALLLRLATAVVASPTGRLLELGYDIWDGTDPPRPPAPELPRDEHLRWQGFRTVNGIPRGTNWYELGVL